MKDNKPSYRSLEQLDKNMLELKRQMANHIAAADQLRDQYHDIEVVRHAVERELKKRGEILDVEAPNCGKTWYLGEKSALVTAFHEFLFTTAKKHGRSTLAIRYKVMEEIIDHIDKDAMLRIWENRR